MVYLIKWLLISSIELKILVNLNYLKNNLEFKWNKPKVTKHIKKVTNDTHEAVKQNIENECASLSAMKRHQKLIELGIAKNFSTQTL